MPFRETMRSDTVEEGEIISQDPADGKMVKKHTTVEVVVSTGPETKTTIVPRWLMWKRRQQKKRSKITW